MESVDRVAVLGAGPGAGAAALELARRGVRTTLYRPARPGEKPCGGALPSYLLDELDGFASGGVPSVRVDRARLENASGSVLELDLRGLRIFRRADFDTGLVAAAASAGTEVVPEKAERLSWRDGRPVVHSDSGPRAFDWVVGADGARGLSRRSLGLGPVGESVGLGASIDGVHADRLTLVFPDLADAYLWIFPRPGGCSVGIAYSPDRLSTGAARCCLDDFLRRHLGLALGDIDGGRYRYPIPVYGPWVAPSLEAARERRVLLVGDAAALADPLTREGIRYAVRSGRWAAEAIAGERPEEYPDRVRAEIDRDLARAHAARASFFDDPVGQWMVPVCRRHTGIRRVLEDLLTCAQPYEGLRRRLLAAGVGLGRAREPRPQAP